MTPAALDAELDRLDALLDMIEVRLCNPALSEEEYERLSVEWAAVVAMRKEAKGA